MLSEHPDGAYAVNRPRRFDRRTFLGLLAASVPAVAIAARNPIADPPVLHATIALPEKAPTARRPGNDLRVGHAPPAILPDSIDLSAPRPHEGAARLVTEIPMLAYSNPVVAENCPDPQVLNDDGTFYMVSTSHTLPAFPIRESTDLVHWRDTGVHVFTNANSPRWANDTFWAPELHRVAHLYVCYYTARSKRSGRLCIGAAVSQAPFGPYSDLGAPLISGPTAFLDPTFFRDEDGRQYLYWKADAAPRDPSGPICVQELTADGLSLIGDRWEIARNDLPWEQRLIEGPSVMKRDGMYYLFYSGGAFNSASYAVGVARSRIGPTGGFVKRGDPILSSSARWQGPGHNSLVHYGDEDFIVFHAWEGERFRNLRPGFIDRLRWTEDGWPEVNDGTPRERWDG